MADGGTSLSYEALVERSMHELRLKTKAAMGLYRLHEARWAVDQETETIVFTRPDGVVAKAPVQIIGSYNPHRETWLWAWANASVLEPLRAHAEAVRRYGESHGVAELVAEKLTCREEDGWRFAALACLLNDAQGVYRGPTDGPFVFMTYGVVTVSKAPAE